MNFVLFDLGKNGGHLEFYPFTIASVLSSKINIWMFMTNELDTNTVEIRSM